jgi:hypothetical protein
MPSTSRGDRNQWDATRFALSLLETLAADLSKAGQHALRRAVQDRGTHRFHDDIKHAISQQQIRRIDAEFRQPTWNATLTALANGTPANLADLQALILAELRDLQVNLAGSDIDLYKSFWNEGPRGQVKAPKSENSCRNALIEALRPRMRKHGVRVEPEAQMANARRTDIAATCADMKLVMELKRHYHAKVWSAASEQLDRFYVRDPEAKGFGIYVVFWFGTQWPTPALGGNRRRPRSADEMAAALTEALPADKRLRIACVTLDVSGGDSRRRTRKLPRTRNQKARKRRSPRKKGKISKSSKKKTR